MWTVEDHRERVLEQIERALPDPGARTPRGRRVAQDRVPISLQLLDTERDHLSDVAAEVAQRHDVAAPTRTDVAVAELRVALRASSSTTNPG